MTIPGQAQEDNPGLPLPFDPPREFHRQGVDYMQSGLVGISGLELASRPPPLLALPSLRREPVRPFDSHLPREDPRTLSLFLVYRHLHQYRVKLKSYGPKLRQIPWRSSKQNFLLQRAAAAKQLLTKVR